MRLLRTQAQMGKRVVHGFKPERVLGGILRRRMPYTTPLRAYSEIPRFLSRCRPVEFQEFGGMTPRGGTKRLSCPGRVVLSWCCLLDSERMLGAINGVASLMSTLGLWSRSDALWWEHTPGTCG